ncbi:hypothetical protein AHAS_Ahas07G0078400 [Arachis hypogaea]
MARKLLILEIHNSNKKSNKFKMSVFSSSTRWHHFYSIEVDGDVAPLPLEFGQLEL